VKFVSYWIPNVENERFIPLAAQIKRSKTKLYKPLPNNLTIKDSKIHGLGVFATEDISENTDLGLTHLLLGKKIFRTPLGGFINHGDDPNCKKLEQNNEFYLLTIKNIKKNEELTVFYTLYNVEARNK
jgi:SET domain-containing protein